MHRQHIRTSINRLKEVEDNFKKGQVTHDDLLKITRTLINILKDKEKGDY